LKQRFGYNAIGQIHSGKIGMFFKEKEVMKTRLWKIIFAILSLLPVCAYSTDITFTSSGSIVDGNVYDNVYVENNGTIVDMSGGQISHLLTWDASIFNMSGGQIIYSWPGITIESVSTINVSGGTINTFDFVVYGSAVANISGGNITADRLKTSPDSVVNINGGGCNFSIIDTSGELNIYRGLVDVNDAYISSIYPSSTVNIFGYDFNYNLGTKILTGYLLDNNFFTIKGVSPSEYARFNLIPEPVSFLLLACGLMIVRKRMR
jgi:hypothetical protein